MLLHERLEQALDQLGLDPATPPADATTWQALLAIVSDALGSGDEDEPEGTMLHAIGDGVAALDARGRITYLNAAAAGLLGGATGGLLGRPLSAILDDGDSSGSGDEHGLGAADAVALGLHYRSDAAALKRLDGRRLPVSFVLTPNHGPGNPAGGAALVFRDVGEWRRTQATLHQARVAAESASMAKSRLLAEVGRALAPRVNSVINMTRTLDQAGLGPEQGRVVAAMRRSAERLVTWLDEVDTVWSDISVEPRHDGLPEPEPGPRPAASHERRVLVVDDNQINRVILSRHVGQLGYQVALAIDAAQAVEAVASGAIDAVLLDVEMPGVSGYEAVREIRLLEPRLGRRLLVIGMMATRDPEDTRRCLAAGMDDVVQVPIGRGELSDLLEGHLAGRDHDDSQPPLDPAALDVLRSLADDDSPDFLQEVVDTYLEQQMRHVDAVRAALSGGDSEAAISEVTMLRGASAHIGAAPLAEHCSVLEHLVLDGDLDGAVGRLDDLTHEAERVQRALSAMRSDAAVTVALAS